MRPDDILRQCNNWRDFKRRLRTASKKEKGDCFEALKLCSLELDYKYQQLLKNVWIPLRTAPREVLGKVGLERQDEGIDGLAEAHDGGEFFTPVSLVSLIANVLEPESGTVLNPACRSGGMFVQSARFVERRHENPAGKLTFRALEKNATTTRLAKMNLAVHGLEGDIQNKKNAARLVNTSRKESLFLANPACMAGVLIALPNFKALCGRRKL